MTRPGIEPRSPGPLANTLTARPIQLYIYIISKNICRNTVNNNEDFSERMNTLLYKNIPLTLYSRKGWCWLCVRGELETGTTAIHWPKVLLTIAALLSHTGWAAQPWVTKSLSPLSGAGSHSAGILSPTQTGTRTDSLKPSVAPGYIFVCRQPASCGRTHLYRIQPRPEVKVIFRYLRPDAPVSLFFLLFTLVHLLIDGSVEGLYIYICSIYTRFKPHILTHRSTASHR